MGKDEIDCIVLPANTSEKQKKKLMLADNKIFSLGKDYLSNIDELLSEFDEFDIPGFDEDVLKNLYNEINEGVPSEDVIPSALGVVPSEKIQEIKKNEQAREESPKEDEGEKYVLQKDVLKNHKDAEENDTRNYITCPHCGVKIYGYN